MSEITDAQRAARRLNAAKAAEARKVAAAARREVAVNGIDESYAEVATAIDVATTALANGDAREAATEVAIAQCLLARLAVAGDFDPERSRAALLSLREVSAECKRRLH